MTDAAPASDAFTPTDRSRARRRPQRAAYDEAAVFAVLDAAVLGHVGYSIDGQPFVTPTAYWREGRKVFWHGAAASRMLAAVDGAPVCLAVSLLDGFVLGRSGILHSVNYRSAMAFGRARRVTAPDAKRAAMNAFLERLYPGRTSGLRPATERELAQLVIVEMTIEEASAKARAEGAGALPEDAGWSAWRGVIPVAQVAGPPLPEADEAGGPGADLAHLAPGARLDAALAAAAGGACR